MSVRKVLLSAALIFISSCFQELDPGADEATRATPLEQGPSTVLTPSAAPIELSVEDEESTTSDPCVKTRQDKTEILTVYCASCHSGPGARGLPPFDFVLDEERLLTAEWVREGQPAQRFVIAGDPQHSLLFQRASTDMPPMPTDLGSARPPAPTPSEIAVLRHWIKSCL